MEQTVFLFCSRKQFAIWKRENCGNCRKASAAWPGCDLSTALCDAPALEGSVPLNVAERLGYFDVDDEDRAVPAGDWTCREFQGKGIPPAPSRLIDEGGGTGGLRGPSPAAAAR